VKRRQPQPQTAAPSSAANDVIVVVAGLAVYVAFLLWLHTWAFSVPPIAW